MRITGNGWMEEKNTLKNNSAVTPPLKNSSRHTHAATAIGFGGHILVRFLDQHIERLSNAAIGWSQIDQMSCSAEEGERSEPGDELRPEAARRVPLLPTISRRQR